MTTEKFYSELNTADELAREAYLEFKAANRAAWKIYHELTFAYAWNDETATLDASYRSAKADADEKLQAYRDANALYREVRGQQAYL